MYSKKQADVILNADARWNILSGAVRSGKTFASYDLIVQRLAELPDGDRIMIGRTQQTLERNVLNPLRRRLGSHFVSAVNSKNTVYIAGKPFYVVGADNKEAVTKIQGLGLVYAYGDEVTTWHEDVFQMLKSRLSDKGALFDGTCNPAYPTHWLKTDILDRSDLDVKQWHFVIDDNPFLPPEYVENLKKEYTGVFYERYILGRWVRAEGAIYRLFADNPQRYFTEKTPVLMEVNIGMDFGGTRSAHSLVATGITPGYKKLIALRSKRLDADGTTPDDVDKFAVEFIDEVMREYGRVDYLYWDSAEQVLGRGVREAVEKAYPTVSVRECYKAEINDRIRLMTRLLGLDMFGYTNNCETLKSALQEAVWDEKKEDTRLDDGTTDIDTLDALEYSFCRRMNNFIF